MIKHYLFDIEGTIIKDKTFTPVAGAADWFKTAPKRGRKFLLATNNTTHSPDSLIKALNENGFEFKNDDLVTCLGSAVDEMNSQKLQSCIVLASDNVKNYFKSKGFNVKDDGYAEAVVVGLDLQINYLRLKIAAEALLKGAALIALHVNKLYKDTDGKYGVSAGGITKALEYTCGKEAVIVGKPSRNFYLKCMKKLNTGPEDAMFISDDPFSDLVGAKKSGMKTCFVLSGKYVSKDVLKEIADEYQPDLIYKDLSYLI